MFFLILFLNSLNTGIIKGFVSDGSNGEKLPFANVYLKGTEIGISTNDKGYYILQKVPEGRYRIVASYIGYEEFEKEIVVKVGYVITLNIELKPKPITVKGIKVTAQRARFERSVEPSRVRFSQMEIKSVPRFFESDLIKVIQLMPGVMAMHDLSNKLYIRGGSPDENLVLLDGITIYNPSTHLFGLFSTFNPDAVASAELLSGGFPAKYGDRLSAVLDVTTKEGNSKRFTGEASTGLVTSKLLLEGPIPKGSFLFSGRRTYFDLIVWGFSKILRMDISLPYYFYDGVAKVNYNPSMENRFTWAGMGGSDVINFSEEDGEGKGKLSWGNQGTSLRWRRVIHPQLYGEILGALSNFFLQVYYGSKEEEFSFNQGIIDYTLKSDFNYFPSSYHTIDFGFEAKRVEFTEFWRYKGEDTTMEESKPVMTPISFAGYLQDKWEVNPILYIHPGLRFIYYSVGNKFRIDPRFGLKYHFRTNTAFNLGVGKFSQYLVTLNSQESYFSIFDFWTPVDESHNLPTAYHIILGIEQWIGEGGRFTIEGYYKKYYNLLIPSRNPLFFSFPSESLKVGDGYATGLDIFLRKSYKGLYGWISYSLGLTKRRVNGKSYCPRYDRRHNFNIVIGSILPKGIPLLRKARLDLRWYFATGLPYAGFLARYRRYYYDFEEDEIWYSWWEYIRGSRDAYRYPPSHRLDLHLEKDMKIFGLNGSWYLDVINVYAHKNVILYDWDYGNPWEGKEFDPPKKREVSFLPYAIPSFGINIKF